MNPQTDSHTQLHGRWLLIARAAWVAFILLTLWMYAVGAPARYEELLAVCVGTECFEGQLTPEKAHALQQLELSLSAYAAYTVGRFVPRWGRPLAIGWGVLFALGFFFLRRRSIHISGPNGFNR